jgi:hypothetical protein
MTQGDLRLEYVIPLFVVAILVIGGARARLSRESPLESVPRRRAVAEHGATFCVFYALSYLLIMPPAGDPFLPLAPARNIELVSHARYAGHALEVGTPDDLHLAPFGYRRSPAASFLIAWQSIFFGRDPLSAALPALFAMTALFGLAGVGVLRRTGLPLPVSAAIMGIILAGPACRSVIVSFGLPEIIAACVLLLPATRSVSNVPGIAAAGVLMVLAEPVSPAWVSLTLRAAGRVVAGYAPHALLGWPGRVSQNTGDLIAAAPLVLPMIVLAWAGVAHVVRRAAALSERLMTSAADRELARALAAYVLVALVIGNVVVDATRDPASLRVTAAWRGMERVNALPFRGLTLKMNDELGSLSTALALYFLPGKRATVIASDVTDEQLRFDSITRQTPTFVHSLGCAGAGHDDTVPANGVGCLLLSPPSPTLGKRYPFSGRYLFLSYQGLSPRLSDGRFNTRPTLPLRVTADPERARLDRPLYLNVLVKPLAPPGTPPQRLSFRWGNRSGETSVAEPTWLSVPVDSSEWEGNRLWTMTLDIDFPDRHPILFQEISLAETPQGRLVGAPAQ